MCQKLRGDFQDYVGVCPCSSWGLSCGYKRLKGWSLILFRAQNKGSRPYGSKSY